MIALALWLLATVDTAFAGWRAAAGRSLRIDKRAYYRRAMLRGALLGQIPVAIAAIAMAARLLSSPAREATAAALQHAGGLLLLVYAPYAALVALGLLVRLAPSVDLRSAASVVIFGPLTLARPLVVVTGAVIALALAGDLGVRLILALVAAMMLAFPPLLDARGG